MFPPINYQQEQLERDCAPGCYSEHAAINQQVTITCLLQMLGHSRDRAAPALPGAHSVASTGVLDLWANPDTSPPQEV